MKGEKLTVKTKKMKKLLSEGGRKGAHEDFFELLKRSLRFKKIVK